MAVNPLKNYHILLADSDHELSRVLRSMMADLGFSQCDVAHDGAEAYRKLMNRPYDFLITEWNMPALSGIDLLKRIRRAPDSPNPVLPIIMLTGRAEGADVVAARDMGINEYVVKPFAAKTIYSRIERIIEHPRSFVISRSFVGPTRRARIALPKGMQDRRTIKIEPQLKPADVHGAMKSADTPRVWLPDFSLKYKLGSHASLDSLITGAVLEQAQAAVDAISDSSLGWIKENLIELRGLLNRLKATEPADEILENMGDLALTINSRAGTFGYSRASDIAYLLYLFCRNRLRADNTNHMRVVEKHVDVLQVILGNRMKGSAGEIGEQMAAELKKLAEKFDA